LSTQVISALSVRRGDSRKKGRPPGDPIRAAWLRCWGAYVLRASGRDCRALDLWLRRRRRWKGNGVLHPRFMERICQGKGASIRHPAIKAADAAKLFDELPGVSCSAIYYSSGLQSLLMGQAPNPVTIGADLASVLNMLGLERLTERTSTDLLDYEISHGYMRGDSAKVLAMFREEGFWKVAYSNGLLITRLEALALCYLEAFLARQLSVAEQVMPCTEELLKSREMARVFGSDRTLIRRAFEQNVFALGCVRTFPVTASSRSSRCIRGIVRTTQDCQEWKERLKKYRATWRAVNESVRKLPPIEVKVHGRARPSDSSSDPSAGSNSTA